MLCVGTKIRFKRTLSCGPTGDHPALEYAHHNETGEITKIGGCWEGYWVKADGWPAAFGCERKDFEAFEQSKEKDNDE